MDIDVKKSLKYYKGEGANIINQALRSALAFHRLPEKMLKHIKNIDNALTTGESLVLYRGLHTIGGYITKQESPIITEQAYTSSSIDIETAYDFTHGEPCCIIKFVLPENIKRFDYKDKHYESEVLLERNLQFQILDRIDDYKDVRVYIALVSKFVPSEIDPIVLEKTRELMERGKFLPYINFMNFINDLNLRGVLEDYANNLKENLKNAIDSSDYEKIEFIYNLFKSMGDYLDKIIKYNKPAKKKVFNILLNLLYYNLDTMKDEMTIPNEIIEIISKNDPSITVVSKLYPNQEETIYQLNDIKNIEILQKIANSYGINIDNFKKSFAIKLLIIDHRNSINDTSDITQFELREKSIQELDKLRQIGLEDLSFETFWRNRIKHSTTLAEAQINYDYLKKIDKFLSYNFSELPEVNNIIFRLVLYYFGGDRDLPPVEFVDELDTELFINGNIRLVVEVLYPDLSDFIEKIYKKMYNNDYLKKILKFYDIIVPPNNHSFFNKLLIIDKLDEKMKQGERIEEILEIK